MDLGGKIMSEIEVGFKINASREGAAEILLNKGFVNTYKTAKTKDVYFGVKGINLDGKESIEYTNYHTTHEIFMVNKDNYVARTNVLLEESDLENKVRGLLEYLIIGGKKESSIPNGFRSIIPSGTEIKSIEIKDKLLKIDFSKEILEIDESL